MKNKKCMIITLGTGKGVEHGIAKSIAVNRPDKIIFIVSKETLEKNMPQNIAQILHRHLNCVLPEYETRLVDDPEKVEKVYQVTYEAIISALRENIMHEDIFLDFTSGTKAMSVGAALAAYLNKCRTMVYVGGSRRNPGDGRVIPNTEVVTIFTLQDMSMSDNYRQDAAADFAFQQKDEIKPPEIKV